MLGHMAVCAEGHEVRECIVTPMAPSDLVMNLKVFQRPALPTPPAIPFQHPLHQAAVHLLPQLDPLYLLQHLLAGSSSVVSDCLVSRVW
jgi:hypothetical protein